MNNNRRQQNRHGGGQGGNYQQRPRKNYAALREKYMNMARDAMSSGDRVLAEYYLQHADHYYRMQQEFLAERAARAPQQQRSGQGQNDQNDPNDAQDSDQDEGGEDEGEVNIPNNSNVLPAFLTRPAPAGSQNPPAPPPQNWEEE